MFKKTMIPFLAGLIAMIAAMTGSMALAGLEGMPSSYLHDRNLDIQAGFVSFVPEETEPIETEIVKLLKKKHKD